MPTSRIPHRIGWAVSQLSVRPTDRVLEIGCGPGHAVGLVCGKLTRGSITAIDRSAFQVTRGRANNESCIASGRARVEHLALEAAPGALGERTFTKVFAVNVNAFWTDAARSFASLSRLLRRNGLAYLIYEPPSAASLGRFKEKMVRLAAAQGFAVVDVRFERFGNGAGLCIIGRPVSR